MATPKCQTLGFRIAENRRDRQHHCDYVHLCIYRPYCLLIFCLFVSGGSAAAAPAQAPHANPFQVTQPAPPTLNQMRVSPMPSGFGMVEPMALSSMAAQPVAMVPLAGMAPMGHSMPVMGAGTVGGVGTSTGMSAGIPASMSMSMAMPQPLMSMPPQAGTQPAGTTNPFLL